jgi:hypothetical protein
MINLQGQRERVSDGLSGAGSGDKGFTGSGNNASTYGGEMCRIGGNKRTQEIERHWRASARACPTFSHLSCWRAQSADRSSLLRLGWRSIRTGDRIHFARIGWRVHWRRAAEPRSAGHDSFAATAKVVCRPPSEHRRRRIESAPIRAELDSAACAGNPFIALAGMLICGMSAPTKTRIGTAPA